MTTAIAIAIALATAAAGAATATTAAPAATITELTTPGAGSAPTAIAASPGGNGALWFGETGPKALASMSFSGTVSAYPGLSRAATDAVVASTGDVWATERNANVIVRQAAVSHVQQEFSTFSGGVPIAIVAGSAGSVWFVESAPNRLVKLDSTGSVLVSTALAGNPAGLAVGPGGNLWVTELTSPARIQEVTPAGAVAATVTLQTSDAPTAIVAGADGALWFADQGSPSAIGRLDPSATPAVTRYATGVTGIPTAIALGPDDDLWFTQANANPPAIGRLIPSTGSVVSYSSGLPAASAPDSIATGLDGNLWFTDPGTDAIGKLVIGPIGATTVPATGVAQSGATLNARIAPNGWPTTYHFEYGPTTVYAQSLPSGSDVTITDSDTGLHDVTAAAAGLSPGTTYHYRIAATTTLGPLAGTVYGDDQTFTTLPAATPGPPPVPVGTVPATTATTSAPSRTTPTSTSTGTTPGPTTTDTSSPAPVAGRTAVAGTISGTVYVTVPGSATPVALGPGQSIPLGAVVDASRGIVRVTNALAGTPRTQSATVWAGRFTMSQDRHGTTIFRPVGAPACSSGRRAHAAARSVKLWAHDHHGRYGTHGRNSVATVRGTEWETVESCAGTRTIVRQGVVSVRDLHTHRSVLVRAGHSVLVGR